MTEITQLRAGNAVLGRLSHHPTWTRRSSSTGACSAGTCPESENAEQTGGYRQAMKDGKPVAGVMPLMQEGQPPAWSTYVSVEDAEATAAAVKEAGRHGDRRADGRDGPRPDGGLRRPGRRRVRRSGSRAPSSAPASSTSRARSPGTSSTPATPTARRSSTAPSSAGTSRTTRWATAGTYTMHRASASRWSAACSTCAAAAPRRDPAPLAGLLRGRGQRRDGRGGQASGRRRDARADRHPGRPLRDPQRPARRRLRGDRAQRDGAARTPEA